MKELCIIHAGMPKTAPGVRIVIARLASPKPNLGGGKTRAMPRYSPERKAALLKKLLPP